jgi:hypothetical protein
MRTVRPVHSTLELQRMDWDAWMVSMSRVGIGGSSTPAADEIAWSAWLGDERDRQRNRLHR